MTGASKSLKDIFDEASTKMLDTEKDVSSHLKVSARSHAERKLGDNESDKRIQDKADELDNELKKHMTNAIERLQKVMESEIKETDEHLKAVKFDLSMLSDKLKTQIIELRQSYEESVNSLCLNLADGYEGAVEHSTTDLERQEFSSSKHLRGHGTFVMNSLQQKLDQRLWESRGEEKNYNSALFKAFMQKANSIDTHFSTLMQQLSGEFQTHYKALEEQVSEAEPELLQSGEKLAGDIDGHSAQVEEEIRQIFKSATEEHGKRLDSHLSAVAQDLSSVHDGTTVRLSQQTKQLSAALVTASGEARESLTTRCTHLRKQVDSMMDSFHTRLEEKLKNTQILKETLDTEKASIFEDIRKELSEILEGFEKRLHSLMAEAVERVSSVSADAEHDISEAFNRCDLQLRSECDAAKAETEEAVTEFLRLLSEQRKSALEQIAKSAGATLEEAEPEPKPTERLRPGRRRKVEEQGESEPRNTAVDPTSPAN
jgi:hypothetical protein